MTDSESRYHAKAVIEAAHALDVELHTKTGTTADWPYRITADNEADAARLTGMLQSLRNALAPFRREPRILEALERSRKSQRPTPPRNPMTIINHDEFLKSEVAKAAVIIAAGVATSKMTPEEIADVSVDIAVCIAKNIHDRVRDPRAEP